MSHPQAQPPGFFAPLVAAMARWMRTIGPFVRRDGARTRAVILVLSVLGLAGSTWLAASAGAGDDHWSASLRASLGMESERGDNPELAYSEDMLELRTDDYRRRRSARLAVLSELAVRDAYNHGRLPGWRTVDAPPPSAAARVTLPALQQPPVRLSFDDRHAAHTIANLARREFSDAPPSTLDLAASDRRKALDSLDLDGHFFSRGQNPDATLWSWIDDGGEAPIANALVEVLRYDPSIVEAVLNQSREWVAEDAPNMAPRARSKFVAIPGQAELYTTVAALPMQAPPERYENPAPVRGFATIFAGLAGWLALLAWTIVAPAVTAYRVASEREVGTLPNLRMTGMSSRALALAIAIGGNAPALAVGGLFATLCVVLTALLGAPLAALQIACALAAGLAAGLAIGLMAGATLGRRFNPSVIASTLAGLSFMGGVTAWTAATQHVYAPFALGPAAIGISGFWTSALAPMLAHHWGTTAHAAPALGYLLPFVLSFVAVHLALKLWERRLEQPDCVPWTRPQAALAVGAVALAWFAVLEEVLRADHHLSRGDVLGIVACAGILAALFIPPAMIWSTPRAPRPHAVPPHGQLARARTWGRRLAFACLGVLLARLVYAAGWAPWASKFAGAGAASLLTAVGCALLLGTQLILTIEFALALATLRMQRPSKPAWVWAAGLPVLFGNIVLTGLSVDIAARASTDAPLAFVPFLSQLTKIGASESFTWTAVMVLVWIATVSVFFFVLARRPADSDEAVTVTEDPEGEDEDDRWGDPDERILH